MIIYPMMGLALFALEYGDIDWNNAYVCPCQHGHAAYEPSMDRSQGIVAVGIRGT